MPLNVFAATRTVAFVTKLFSAAGLSLQQMVDAGDENALKAHLTQAVASAPPPAGTPTAEEVAAASTAVENAVAENTKLSALIKELETQLAAATTASAQLATLNAGLTAAGIKITAADAAKGITAVDVTAAIDHRVSLKAAELAAQTGTRPIETTVTNVPAAAKTDKTLKKGTAGLAQLFAAAAK